jgi:hypothetical protein
MVHSRAQRFGDGFRVDVDFAAGDDAIKNAEHCCDSDQEAQSEPLCRSSAWSLAGALFLLRYGFDFVVGQIGQRRRHDTVAANVEHVG